MMSLCCSLLSSVREGKVDPTLSGALSRDDSVSPFSFLFQEVGAAQLFQEVGAALSSLTRD